MRTTKEKGNYFKSLKLSYNILHNKFLYIYAVNKIKDFNLYCIFTNAYRLMVWLYVINK